MKQAPLHLPHKATSSEVSEVHNLKVLSLGFFVLEVIVTERQDCTTCSKQKKHVHHFNNTAHLQKKMLQISKTEHTFTNLTTYARHKEKH